MEHLLDKAHPCRIGCAFSLSKVYLNHAANGKRNKTKHLGVSHVLSEFNNITPASCWFFCERLKCKDDN